MQRVRFSCLAILAGLLAGGSPALADKTFDFVQVGNSSPPGVMTASGSLTITDAAFRSGLNIFASFGPGCCVDLSGDGIVFLDFEATNFLLGTTLSMVGNNFGDVGQLGGVFLVSRPGGKPTGTIDFTIDFGFGGDGFEFDLGQGSTASFSTDNPDGYPCTFAGFCHVPGLWEPVGFSIAEPATVSLVIPFAVGLLANGRRKRNRVVRSVPRRGNSAPQSGIKRGQSGLRLLAITP